MKKNNLLKKELKKINNYIYITLIFISLGLLFIGYGIYENNEKNYQYYYLNDIIENKNNEENINAYLKIVKAPYSIAKYQNEDHSAFYIVFDGNYYYIAYLSDEIYAKLNKENIEEKPITIYGTTAAISSSLKDIAIKVYNKGLDEEDTIEIKDFNSYFGEVYLTNVSLTKEHSAFFYLSIIPFAIACAFLVLYLIKMIKNKKVLATLTEKEMKTLEKEINDKNTKYYETLHLILTKNYIISFNKTLKIINQNNLIWIYEYKTKQYGITTSKQIFVMDNTGKKYNIVATDGLSRKTDSTLKEIMTIVSNKSEKILIGYNKRNESEINQILKNS